MAIYKSSGKHLTAALRAQLEAALMRRLSFSQIKRELGIPRSTIKREIINRRIESTKVFYGRTFNPCRHRNTCQLKGLCSRSGCTRRVCAHCGKRCRAEFCSHFEEEVCLYLTKAPYVCNGCANEVRCRLRKYYYVNKVAQEDYAHKLSSSRQGVNITEGQLRAINELLVPALNKGQSPFHAMTSAPEVFPICERTVYKYINAGILAVARHNLPMAVRYKRRKGNPPEHRVDRHCTEGRRWEDYLKYLDAHKGIQVPQADTVEGQKGDKCMLLTIHFRAQKFMIARLMPGKCAKYVADVFNWLWQILGKEAFMQLFPAILKDNGTEFTNPLSIEHAPEDGTRRTSVYYTRRKTPTDKAQIERNHTYIRRVIFKGESFDKLTQEKVNLTMSHVNSYVRKELLQRAIPCRTPYERFVFEYGEEVAKKLGIVPIPLKEVTLRPDLLDMD